MESHDLNSPSADDRRLEALLRQPEAPLPDDGFSARVLAALPPPPTAAARLWISRPRLVSALAGTAVGLACAFGSGIKWPEAAASLDRAIGAILQIGAAVADPQVALALLIAAVSLAAVYQAELRAKMRSLV